MEGACVCNNRKDFASLMFLSLVCLCATPNIAIPGARPLAYIGQHATARPRLGFAAPTVPRDPLAAAHTRSGSAVTTVPPFTTRETTVPKLFSLAVAKQRHSRSKAPKVGVPKPSPAREGGPLAVDEVSRKKLRRGQKKPFRLCSVLPASSTASSPPYLAQKSFLSNDLIIHLATVFIASSPA